MNALKHLEVALIIALLREAREHITAKPWDDGSCLHARISEALGLPVEYPDDVAKVRGGSFLMPPYPQCCDFGDDDLRVDDGRKAGDV